MAFALVWLVFAFAVASEGFAENSGDAKSDSKSVPASLVLAHVTIIDCTGREAQPDMSVVVTGDRITALGKAGEVVAPQGAEVVDGRGKFLIPGLWDMHAHCFHRSYLPLFVANGVTGARMMWGTADHLAWRKEIEDGSLLGPRMILAGAPVDGPDPVWPGSLSAANREEGEKAVRTIKESGFDFVKVYSLLPEEAFVGLATEAKRQGIAFGGHVPECVSAARASELGQKSIEHLWGVALACSSKEEELRKAYLAELKKAGPAMLLPIHQRYLATSLTSYDEKRAAALFAGFVRNGTWHVPTLTVLRPKAFRGDKAFTEDARLKYMLPSDRAYWQRIVARPAEPFPDSVPDPVGVYRKELSMTGALHKAGVKLLAGTDCPGPYCFPGFSVHDELALLVEAGLSPMDALQTATRNAAEFLGREADFGSVEVGKVADLVLLDANPLVDIRNTVRIDCVVARGRVLNREALDELLAKAEAVANKK